MQVEEEEELRRRDQRTREEESLNSRCCVVLPSLHSHSHTTNSTALVPLPFTQQSTKTIDQASSFKRTMPLPPNPSARSEICTEYSSLIHSNHCPLGIYVLPNPNNFFRELTPPLLSTVKLTVLSFETRMELSTLPPQRLLRLLRPHLQSHHPRLIPLNRAPINHFPYRHLSPAD